MEIKFIGNGYTNKTQVNTCVTKQTIAINREYIGNIKLNCSTRAMVKFIMTYRGIFKPTIPPTTNLLFAFSHHLFYIHGIFNSDFVDYNKIK